jgi:transposase
MREMGAQNGAGDWSRRWRPVSKSPYFTVFLSTAWRKAREKLDAVRTPEGIPLPPNTVAALQRHMQRFCAINEQIKAIEQTRLQRLQRDPADRFNAMVFLLVRIIGLGMETAEQLVREVLSRPLRDRKAVARYSGLTGSPDESGSKRRQKGLSRSGNGRVRNIMIQLSWRMLLFQPESGGSTPDSGPRRQPGWLPARAKTGRQRRR